MDSPTPEELDALDRLTDDPSAAGASPDIRALADLVHAITDATQDGDGLDIDATWRRIHTAIRAERVDAIDSRAQTLPAPPSEAASMQRRDVPASPDSTRLIVAARRFTRPSVPAVRSFMPAALAAGMFAVAITLSLLFLTSNSASAGFLATVARLEEAATEALADGVLTSEELEQLDVRVAALIAAIDAESDRLPDLPPDVLDAALATVERIGGELQTAVAGQIADIPRADSQSVAVTDTHLRRFARVAVAALAGVPGSVRKVIGPSEDAQGETSGGEEAEPVRPPRTERPDAETPGSGGEEAEPVRPPQAERTGRSDAGATGRTNSTHVEATGANGACKDERDPADLNSVHWPCPPR